MPKNKNFQKRITILDECFSNPSGTFTIDKLIDVVSKNLGLKVSRKTIQNDIRYIREFIENEKAQIIDFDEISVFQPNLFEGKKTIFRYSLPGFSLGNHLLNKSDREQLEETLSILSRYKERQDFYWLEELFPRIRDAFNLVHQDYDGLISYQSNRDYIGQPWVGKVYNMILHQKKIRVEYKGFKDENSYKRLINPYHLKQYNNRWFLFGYEEGMRYNGITNLALDRIVDIEQTVEDIKPNEINWGDYFDEMIGVSRNSNESYEIKLKFSKSRIPYVLTKPIHGASQRLDRSDPEGRTIILNLIPNNEFFQSILSFGEDVEIISPDSIRDKISRRVREMYNHYANN